MKAGRCGSRRGGGKGDKNQREERDGGMETERIGKWGMEEQGRRSVLVGLVAIRGYRN